VATLDVHLGLEALIEEAKHSDVLNDKAVR